MMEAKTAQRAMGMNSLILKGKHLVFNALVDLEESQSTYLTSSFACCQKKTDDGEEFGAVFIGESCLEFNEK